MHIGRGAAETYMLNMHRKEGLPIYRGETTGPADPASGGGHPRGAAQNQSNLWDIFCKLN